MKRVQFGRRILALVAAFIVSACAGPRSDLTRSDTALVDGQSGAVVASLGASVPATGITASRFLASSLDLSVKSLTDTTAQAEHLISTEQRYDQAAHNPTARLVESGARELVVRKLKPGRYAVVEARATARIGTIGYSANPKILQPLEFEVRAGTITYLGTFEVRIVPGKNLFGQGVPSRAVISLLDDEEELDMYVLRRIRPEMKGVPVLRLSRAGWSVED